MSGNKKRTEKIMSGNKKRTGHTDYRSLSKISDNIKKIMNQIQTLDTTQEQKRQEPMRSSPSKNKTTTKKKKGDKLNGIS